LLSPPLSKLAPPEFVSAARYSLTDPPVGVDPWFHRYFGDLSNDRGLETYVRAEWQMVSLAGGVRDKVVVDAGSGFGMGSNLLSHWGARRVFSVELHRPMVESHRRMLDQRFTHLRNVHPIRADVSRLPLATASADLLLSIEAISHYYEVDRFLDECARVVKPGGCLIVSDGNNAANPSIRASTEEIWERWENGPHGPAGCHDIQETLTERRARIIRGLYPDLTPVQVERYAKGTAGLDQSQIRDAIEAHRNGGPEPTLYYQRGQLPRDPDWGYVVERLFDPPELKRSIEQRGFEAQTFAHFGGARNDLILAANLVLRRLPVFRFAKAFRIVAVRR
jgi:SAM-dependent methyltransferase